jgi:C4-dicarboxylate-specific signal transduction histidine kinase
MIEGAQTAIGYSGSVAKRFLVVFLMATGLLAVAAATHYFVIEKTERVERKTSELLNLQLGQTAIVRNLENVTSDLMFLARHNESENIFEDDDHGLRLALAKQFLVFSKQKGKYDQIRVLDQTGMEIVRVNYNSGIPAIVPRDRLQNKSERYYFAETWPLKRGEVYISPFDLNIERGQIEQPPKPMVRLGTPMFDRSGRKSGIVLLNYLGEALIRDFRGAAANISNRIMLLNNEGYWLSSPRPEDEWSFMYGNDRTFGKAHPDAWQRINNEETGQFYTEEGMFSFTTIYPVLHIATDPRPGQRTGTPVRGNSYYWKAVSHLASQSPMVALREFSQQHRLLYGLMLSLLAIASLLIADLGVRHQKAASKAAFEKNFRGLLEQKVKERTQELKYTVAEKSLVVQHLIQAEKMAAIGTMASGIGHEINSPLYAILGMAEAIEDEKEVSQIRAYGREILKYSKEIAGIVRNLSGYVRPADEQDIKLADVNEKLNDGISMARRSLLDDRVEIKEDLMPVPGVLANSEEIQQIFFNVIRNAIQAMGKEGTLEISSRLEGDRVSVRIRDTGVGIPEEHLGKIFDPFFTTKGPEEGEGMGLYVAYQIVKKWAGTITFESQVGKGTVCTIQFPVGIEERGNLAQ